MQHHLVTMENFEDVFRYLLTMESPVETKTPWVIEWFVRYIKTWQLSDEEKERVYRRLAALLDVTPQNLRSNLLPQHLFRTIECDCSSC